MSGQESNTNSKKCGRRSQLLRSPWTMFRDGAARGRPALNSMTRKSA
ncbi:MAG: hypothetical protein K8S15_08895 [Candidatus Aegiribacteria sp.]|nr:hypothetical protein [Candidatus Aegiribacteria sp.]